jgi:thioredoxin reductase (NADPH)
MMELFAKQAERFGADIRQETVTSVDFSSRPYKITSDSGEYLAKTVIIATGATAKWLGIPSEKVFSGFGVSACATCDGFFFRGKEVIVVGGGDTAMEEATYLTRHCSKVYVVHRRNELRASKIMQQRGLENPKIEFVWNAVIEEILGQSEPHKKVTGVRLKDTQTGETREMAIDGVFMGIGHQPASGLFKGVIDMDETGYITVQGQSTRTNVLGVFACGDVADKTYRQAISAAGTGCMAAIDAERLLEEEGE